MSDICQIQIQIQKVPPCIWKYTRLFGFSHTCVVFAKHPDMSNVFGKNHTCVVFTKYLRPVQVFGKNHICVVFTKHLDRSRLCLDATEADIEQMYVSLKSESSSR